jgi:transposase-like protein
MPASKYKPSYGKQVLEFMSQGKSVSAAAEHLGVHRDTLYEWAKVHPKFTYYFDRARQACIVFWERKLEECALNDQNKNSAQYKHLEFILANRARDLYGKAATQEIKISQVEALSDEELDKRLKELSDGKDPDGDTVH